MKRINLDKAYKILQDKSATYKLKCMVEDALTRDIIEVNGNLSAYLSIFDEQGETA